MTIEKIDEVYMFGHVVGVYGSLEEPFFLAVELGAAIDYSNGNIHRMVDMLELDEVLYLEVDRPYQRKSMTVKNVRESKRRRMLFVNEYGMNHILMRSSKPKARDWQRRINEILVDMRRGRSTMQDWYDDLAPGDWDEHFTRNFGYSWNEIMEDER